LRENVFWAALDRMVDFWSDIAGKDLRGEGNVELRLVIPLLHALGYEDDDIDSKYPVIFQEGRLGRKPEADFVCFHGPLHNRDTSLLVVEAKRPGEEDGGIAVEHSKRRAAAPSIPSIQFSRSQHPTPSLRLPHQTTP
jgi:hypothetical protein